MLVPAILYKDEIIEEYQKLYYTKDMLYETGSLNQWCPDISETPERGCFQYAIITPSNGLIGYLEYQIYYYVSKAYNFGLISFNKGNPTIGKDLFNKMEELIQRLHKVEWRMVSGNPVEKSYDRFCEKHNGYKHILKDELRDADGYYHDDVVYEIIKEKQQ